MVRHPILRVTTLQAPIVGSQVTRLRGCSHGKGLPAFTGNVAIQARPSHWRPFAALAGGVLNTRPVCLEGATLTSKQVHDYMRTSKVMARTPVTGRKTEWYIASTLEILGVLSSRTIRQLCKHLRQVVAPIQVDGEDHCGRSVQHRTAL